MRFAARSDVGLVRKLNQDAYIVQPDPDGTCVAIVADGMGGEAAGEVASSLALAAVAESLRTPADASAENLADAVRSANARIYEQASAVASYAGMGTTIVAVLADRRRLVVAHVGDSRAYLYRAGAGLRRLTEDHSLVNELVRRGQLLPEEAASHPQRHILTRSLGPLPDVAVECREWTWQKDDLVLICSDGLTSLVEEAELRACLAAGAELSATVDALLRSALERGGHDNVTVALLANDGDEEWRECG